MTLDELILNEVPRRGQQPVSIVNLRLAVLRRANELPTSESIRIRTSFHLVDEAVFALRKRGKIILTSHTSRRPVRIGETVRGRIEMNPRGFHGLGTIENLTGYTLA